MLWLWNRRPSFFRHPILYGMLNLSSWRKIRFDSFLWNVSLSNPSANITKIVRRQLRSNVLFSSAPLLTLRGSIPTGLSFNDTPPLLAVPGKLLSSPFVIWISPFCFPIRTSVFLILPVTSDFLAFLSLCLLSFACLYSYCSPSHVIDTLHH